MYPGTYAITDPNKLAIIMEPTGRKITYKELDSYSNKIAHLLREKGVKPGDVIAIFTENIPEFLFVAWAAQRSGLYYTAISSRLSHEEVSYIVNDSGAKAFFTSLDKAGVANQALADCPNVESKYVVNGKFEGFLSLPEEIVSMPSTKIKDEVEGCDLLYSSGTTGRPKGVKLPIKFTEIGTAISVQMLLGGLYGANSNSIYLSPAPLYHAAPLRFTMAMQRIGGTSIIMEHFDPIGYLKLIEKYHVTHTQVVPTMFVRLLKLEESARNEYDVSSLRYVIHAAAPCPVPVKKDMINWFGPVLYEYYAGTEGNGFVSTDSYDWLKHEGSVGRPLLGKIHILDENSNELETGVDGIVYFEGGNNFEYLNDKKKTAESRSKQGYSTLGDVGHLDSDGFLYLTDRLSYMIISGGVNIYPQEVENLLVTHPKVLDVAVFGIPDPDFGEQVKAVVQPLDMSDASKELEEELISFCKSHLASFKCPKSVDFEAELPRHPTGKLYKRLLVDRYKSAGQPAIN